MTCDKCGSADLLPFKVPFHSASIGGRPNHTSTFTVLRCLQCEHLQMPGAKEAAERMAGILDDDEKAVAEIAAAFAEDTDRVCTYQSEPFESPHGFVQPGEFAREIEAFTRHCIENPDGMHGEQDLDSNETPFPTEWPSPKEMELPVCWACGAMVPWVRWSKSRALCDDCFTATTYDPMYADLKRAGMIQNNRVYADFVAQARHVALDEPLPPRLQPGDIYSSLPTGAHSAGLGTPSSVTIKIQRIKIPKQSLGRRVLRRIFSHLSDIFGVIEDWCYTCAEKFRAKAPEPSPSLPYVVGSNYAFIGRDSAVIAEGKPGQVITYYGIDPDGNFCYTQGPPGIPGEMVRVKPEMCDNGDVIFQRTDIPNPKEKEK